LRDGQYVDEETRIRRVSALPANVDKTERQCRVECGMKME